MQLYRSECKFYSQNNTFKYNYGTHSATRLTCIYFILKQWPIVIEKQQKKPLVWFLWQNWSTLKSQVFRTSVIKTRSTALGGNIKINNQTTEQVQYKILSTECQYLLEGLHILVWSIGDGFLGWGIRLLFGKRLYVARGTGNNRRQRLSAIRRVKVYVANEPDILAIRLGNVGRIRVQRMAVRCFHFNGHLLASIQTRWQIDSIKRPTTEHRTNNSILAWLRQFSNLTLSACYLVFLLQTSKVIKSL